MKLSFDRGGDGDRLLVLLHGLGATRQVWRPMLQSAGVNWNSSWIAPDLRGHGASPAAMNYALGNHAADVADLALSSGQWNEIVVFGHSMGGAIGLALASGWFGFTPSRVFGLGIKVTWTAEERERLAVFASTSPRRFASREEAIERYMKISGLRGLVEEESPIAQAGIKAAGDRWELAASPATASLGAPPMSELVAEAKCPFHLGRGTTDALVSIEELRRFDPDAEDIGAAGHNAMVEDPSAVWAWLCRQLP
jgi:pimeloyl-ACP methyl ester carboxylesterase